MIRLLLMLLLVLCGAASAAEPAKSTAKGPVRISPASALHRHRIEQAVAYAWGVDGSPARLAAQLHQESGFRADAASPVGAQGMAQFMPKTGAWIATVFPEELRGFDPWNAQQAIMAAALYDKWLFNRVGKMGTGRIEACDRWAFALRAYNGGEGWMNRERRLALNGGVNANNWHAVEPFRARASWAHKENINYPRRILLVLEPAYLAAGWRGGSEVCN